MFNYFVITMIVLYYSLYSISYSFCIFFLSFVKCENKFKIELNSIFLMHWRHKGSRLHNNGARLVSRSAHVLCWQCALALSLSVRGPGRASPAVWQCRGCPPGCMLGDDARGSASFDPQRSWAPFCDVICIWSIELVLVVIIIFPFTYSFILHFLYHSQKSLCTKIPGLSFGPIFFFPASDCWDGLANSMRTEHAAWQQTKRCWTIQVTINLFF